MRLVKWCGGLCEDRELCESVVGHGGVGGLCDSGRLGPAICVWGKILCFERIMVMELFEVMDCEVVV